MNETYRSIHHLATCLLVAMLVLSCAPEPVIEPTGVVTSSITNTQTTESFAPKTGTLITATPQPMLPRGDSSECPPNGLPVHTIDATLDWDNQTIEGQEQINFTNTTGHALPTIVLALPMHVSPDAFTIHRVAIGPNYTFETFEGFLQESRLEIALPAPLQVGESVEIGIEFSLNIPEIARGYRKGHLGYLGYSSNQTNLGHWFPVVAQFDRERGWIAPPSVEIGESYVLPAAHFFVTIHVDGAPDTLRVAGPGTMIRKDALSWQFALCNARDLALSLSTRFGLLTTSTENGIDIEVFYLNSERETLVEEARHTLLTATNSLEYFASTFGAYPYPRLVIVEGDFPDGMEFSGLVFVSEAWFSSWQGTPNEWLTLITVHEVAHQWWYALVGNDQGQFPWLDEALSTYSEALFFEEFYPEHLPWWWQFRVLAYQPTGAVNSPVATFTTARAYINAIYLRGALMWDDLRNVLGDTIFFEWLRNYVRQYAQRIATPDDLWNLLPPASLDLTVDIRAEYLSPSPIVRIPDSIP